MNKFEREIPEVSIVMPSWFTNHQNGKFGENETFWFACHCLNRLLATESGVKFELIIIDNGSTLGEGEVNSSRFLYTPSAYFKLADIVIRNKENLGFGPACNQGFNIARGKYIVCLNNDILVWENWLKIMIDDFENEANFNDGPCGVLMPALEKTYKDPNEELTLKKPDLSQNKGEFGPNAGFGSLWMSTKKILNEIRLLNKEELGVDTVFDETFRIGYGEDRKIWDQIRMTGRNTYRSHNLRVYHLGGLSMSKAKKNIDNSRVLIDGNREYLSKWRKKHNIGE